nr:glycine-rich cell wall structural protein [Aegilops tauschii subsp. strangulata]
MASFKLTNLCFIVVMFSAVFSCCRGQGGGGGAGAGAGGGAGGGSGIGAVVPGTQDSVQIVAQAALCFDNRPVLTGCLQAMGINASGTGASMPPPAPGGAATAIMCSPPCFGHVTMMMSCVNAIFGNFVTYNPGLMQGVQAVFQMSCGNVNGPGGAGGAAGGMGGRPAGNAGGGAGAGGMGGGPAGNAGGGAGAGSASGGVGGGAAGGIPNGIGGPGGAFLTVSAVPLARPVPAGEVPVVLLTSSAGPRAEAPVPAELAAGLEAATALPTAALPPVPLAAATSQASHPMQARTWR